MLAAEAELLVLVLVALVQAAEAALVLVIVTAEAQRGVVLLIQDRGQVLGPVFLIMVLPEQVGLVSLSSDTYCKEVLWHITQKY